MLPIGCVHIDLPRAEELAKRLGKVVYLDRLTCRQVPTVLDVFYGRALTGFQFRKENTIPVINGIVVCKEDAIFLMEVSLLSRFLEFIFAMRREWDYRTDITFYMVVFFI
jgi:hypothetical protein